MRRKNHGDEGQAVCAHFPSHNSASFYPVYVRGIEWLLRNQLSDGSWFMPTRAVPIQPHTFESGFPHGRHQFASDSASSWAAMALLFTLPDIAPAKAELFLAPQGRAARIAIGRAELPIEHFAQFENRQECAM